MPPYGPSDATAVEAYWHWCDGMSFSQIAAAMAGPPHHCGGKSTAVGWVERGRVIESMSGGPLARRRAQRERVAFALDRMRVTIEEEIKAGLLPRHHGRKLQIDILHRYALLLALPAAPATRKVKLTGDSNTAALPRELLEALAAVSPDELLPHERTDP